MKNRDRPGGSFGKTREMIHWKEPVGMDPATISRI
jgi:hypothetical protein